MKILQMLPRSEFYVISDRSLSGKNYFVEHVGRSGKYGAYRVWSAPARASTRISSRHAAWLRFKADVTERLGLRSDALCAARDVLSGQLLEAQKLKVAAHASPYSLERSTLINIFNDLTPHDQGEDVASLNIGFGFVYYSLARTLRPRVTVVIGSRKGFSAICIALGVRDNYPTIQGRVYLVDPGYSDESDGKEKGMGGLGLWKNQEYCKRLLSRFDLKEVLEIFPMRSEEFSKTYQKNEFSPIDLLFIDADHSYEGFQYDFETYTSLLSERGIVVAHDPLVRTENLWGYRFGVSKLIEDVIAEDMKYEYVTLPPWPGLFIGRKRASRGESTYPNQLRALIQLYEESSDLRLAFPEAALGYHDRLVKWAIKVSTGECDDSRRERVAAFVDGLKAENDRTKPSAKP